MPDLQRLFPMIAMAGLAFVVVIGIVFAFNMYFAIDNEAGSMYTSQNQQANQMNYTWMYIIAAILIIIFVSVGLAVAKGWLFK